MADSVFRAIVVERTENGDCAELRELDEASLPEGDVTVRLAYSSLNYKDGLAVTGSGKIVRRYPMIPGIDLAGTVLESSSSEFRPGDEVLATGWGLGETQWGGYSQRARLKADHLLRLPEGMSLRQAMALGTAGLTAMLSLLELEGQGVAKGGDVLVTGAAGGVGSVAVAILARAGFRPVASTGRPEAHNYLRSLGAEEILDRSAVGAPSERPLESARWAGAIDSVGGDTLAAILRTTQPHGTVAACGLAGGYELKTTLMPFILRGVKLIGIDSNYCPNARRKEAWQRLATDLPAGVLESMTEVVPLADVLELAALILQGKVRGRTVVDINA